MSKDKPGAGYLKLPAPDATISVVPVDPNLTVEFKPIECQCGFVFTIKTDTGYDMRPAYGCHVCKASHICFDCLKKNHQH